MSKHLKLGFYVFFVPIFLWLFLLIILPQIDLFLMSFKFQNDAGNTVWGFGNYELFFTEKVYWLTFARTAIYSILVTFLTFVITFPIAFYLSKIVSPKFKGFLIILILMPFWVSELVRIYGWMILLRESGVINYFLLKFGLIHEPIQLLYNNASMILGLVYTSMLFMVIPVLSSLEGMDDSYIEAAYDLGASKRIIFFKIIIPYAAPGIVAGSIMVFMLTLGDYLTPDLMGGKYSLWFTEQIYNQFIASFNWNQGAAFGFLLLSLSSFVVWIGLKLSKQNLEEAVA